MEYRSAEDIFVNNVITLYDNKDWKKIINNCNGYSEHTKLLWVFPSENNITFLGDTLKKFNNKTVVSIGCGSGLLEWILMESLGLNVVGLEIDGTWWKSKYAPKSFIPLHFVKGRLEDDLPTRNILKTENSVLLFCYFNNGPAFAEYIKYFTGNVIIIIGPGEGRNTHTNPTPFTPNLDERWKLVDSQEVRNTKDFIAIYRRLSHINCIRY